MGLVETRDHIIVTYCIVLCTYHSHITIFKVYCLNSHAQSTNFLHNEGAHECNGRLSHGQAYTINASIDNFPFGTKINTNTHTSIVHDPQALITHPFLSGEGAPLLPYRPFL